MLKLSEVLNRYTNIFHFCTSSWEIIDVFSDLTKTLTLAFLRTLFKGGFQTLRDYNLGPFNLARDLAIYTWFDERDLISKSQVCKLLLDSCSL